MPLLHRASHMNVRKQEVWPAGVEPAVSGARSRRGGHLPYDQTSTPGGTRTRTFRVEGPASSPVRPRGHVELRRQESNLRLTINSRASCRLDHTGTRRKGRESNPQGPRAHPFSRRGTAPVAALPSDGIASDAAAMASAGVEPATAPIKSRRLFQLSYEAGM